MKAIETYLNLIHFCFYKAHYRMHLLANKINPFRLIHKLPFQKKRYEELGIDINKEINRSFGDKKFGLSTMIAGGILWGMLGIFFLSLLILFNIMIYATMPYVIVCCVLSGIVCYLFVFKDDKYLKYFDEFEKCSRLEKWRYGWLTLGSTIALFILFYIGLIT